jgi:hypothetical protein
MYVGKLINSISELAVYIIVVVSYIYPCAFQEFADRPKVASIYLLKYM